MNSTSNSLINQYHQYTNNGGGNSMEKSNKMNRMNELSYIQQQQQMNQQGHGQQQQQYISNEISMDSSAQYGQQQQVSFPGPMMLQHPALMANMNSSALASVMQNMQNGITANVIEAAAANGFMDSTTANMITSRSADGGTNTVVPSTNEVGDNTTDTMVTTSTTNVNVPGTGRGRGSKRKRTKIAIPPTTSIVPPGESVSETTLGGVSIPPVPKNSSTALQVEVAAAAAAAAAAPLKSQGKKQSKKDKNENKDEQQSNASVTSEDKKSLKRSKVEDMTPEERAKQNRDRNREHARSTRLRKKAYVNKLKELVEGLHAERSEEVRKRRVAIQQLAEVQKVRREVVKEFLRLHSNYDCDVRKWNVLLEENFWLKQPVTPYRSFRRIEIENECRISRGIEAVIADSASMSVMVESIGSRNTRWMSLKREEFLSWVDKRPNTVNSHNNSHLQHAISSLSSSSTSGGSQGNGSGAEEDRQSRAVAVTNTPNNSEFHDYNAPCLPDIPAVDAESSDTPNCTAANSTPAGICTDSSSAEDNDKRDVEPILCTSSSQKDLVNKRLQVAPAIPLAPFTGLGNHKKSNVIIAADTTLSSNTPGKVNFLNFRNNATNAQPSTNPNNMMPYSHIQAYYHMNEDDMLLTDDVLMCPFIFRSQDAVTCGACAECVMPGMIRAQFQPRTNKLLSVEMVYDSMGFMQQLERASGSEGLAQIVPNSLEMALSPNNCHEARVITLAKPPYLIVSINELWTKMTKYTQMEVEGKELSILNGSKTQEFTIHSNNTNTGVGISSNMSQSKLSTSATANAARLTNTTHPHRPVHDFAEVSKGRCACSVNIHYDKHGKEFVDFVCSYPLTNADDEITHMLHIYKELKEPNHVQS